ncbi:GCN5 family acetyltransferase [Streptomyces sp. NRRL F-4489]|uniref:GNAT family N-acetyltransferase n=1 Tax=Streptomyces sp. NRRL F-4489 TaxID=1609095 RepID=UPI00074717A4|nr:GNAT family N-acetyltransferase [Streptomyces sp. NRRL F-4489]KUL38672.1 GCN5 family acetyltransferase [Streptomyces sp. NRRL F-4489]
METDHAAVLARYDHQLRRSAPPDPGTRVERDGPVVRQTGGPDDWNGVLWSDLDEATADAAIAAQVRHFTARGHGFEWKAYAHDRPADLGARLRAAGFTPEPAESLMVARSDGPAAAGEPPPGVRLAEVTGPEGVELVVRVHTAVFGTSAARLRHRLLTRLARDPGTLVLTVALADGEPVSAARLELPAGTDFAGLWGGGTLPEWRGRGLYRALVARRARLAAARGFRYVQVDATDQSSPILDRLGFAMLTTTRPYAYRP